MHQNLVWVHDAPSPHHLERGSMIDPEYLARFQADLRQRSAQEIYDTYVRPTECKGMPELDEAGLRAQVSDRFSVPADNVIIVGSAKVGFTLRAKPGEDGEPDRPAFSPVADTSDVDLAIVSDRLFDEIWKACFEFWHSSGYANSGTYWPRAKNFRDYIFRGWMRPDWLPSEGGFVYKNEWFDFFRGLTSARAAGDYKITAGLYREEYFLRTYQCMGIAQCQALYQGAA